MSQKPTLAFIDNVFHQRTMSADFFRELLLPHFDLVNFWDKTSQKGPRIDIDTINKHNYVMFWQRLNPVAELEKVTAKMIWVPMYDSISFDFLFWKNLSLLPIKVLCFSKAIYRQCQKFGIESMYVQYFSKPEWSETEGSARQKPLFFWNRGSVSFEMVKRIIDPFAIEKFIHLSRPDPNYKQECVGAEDKERFKMETVETDFQASRTEYFEMMKRAGLFVAPRKKEGIGLSFVEAMAMGLTVIAYDEGTMNEYIEHNRNGYLFDENTKGPLDFSSLPEVNRNSREAAKRGYEKWLGDKKLVVDFLNKAASERKPSVARELWRKLYALKLWQFKVRMKFFGV